MVEAALAAGMDSPYLFHAKALMLSEVDLPAALAAAQRAAEIDPASGTYRTLVQQLQGRSAREGPMQEALAAYEAQDWPTVVTLCRSILSLDPASLEALQMLAVAAEQQGQPDVERQAWTDLLSKSTDAAAPEVWPRARDRLAELGLSVPEALRQGGASAWQCHLLARWLESEGDQSAALASWGQALAVGPPHIEYHFGRHRTLMRTGRAQEALEAAQAAAAMAPESFWAETYCGDALVALGRQSEALQHWESALDLAASDDLRRQLQGRIERAR